MRYNAYYDLVNIAHLLVSLLQVFHENCHHDIDQHKLGQQHEHDKEQGSEILWIAKLDIELFLGSNRPG